MQADKLIVRTSRRRAILLGGALGTAVLVGVAGAGWSNVSQDPAGHQRGNESFPLASTGTPANPPEEAPEATMTSNGRIGQKGRLFTFVWWGRGGGLIERRPARVEWPGVVDVSREGTVIVLESSQDELPSEITLRIFGSRLTAKGKPLAAPKTEVSCQPSSKLRPSCFLLPQDRGVGIVLPRLPKRGVRHVALFAAWPVGGEWLEARNLSDLTHLSAAWLFRVRHE